MEVKDGYESQTKRSGGVEGGGVREGGAVVSVLRVRDGD